MPALPDELLNKFTSYYKLPPYDAGNNESADIANALRFVNTLNITRLHRTGLWSTVVEKPGMKVYER